ncbi:MAG: hypothetical protein ACKO2K_10875, partial [Alphaproteobacteria bacterium]
MTDHWHPIGPGAMDGLPDSPGVFVLGTMVRSILLVGIAEERGLRAAVVEAVARGPLAHRARCFRFEACPDPRARQAELLDEYRGAHGGMLPPEQPAVGPSLRAVLGASRKLKAPEAESGRSRAEVGAPPSEEST